MELDDTDRERKRAKKEKHSSKDRSHRPERKDSDRDKSAGARERGKERDSVKDRDRERERHHAREDDVARLVAERQRSRSRDRSRDRDRKRARAEDAPPRPGRSDGEKDHSHDQRREKKPRRHSDGGGANGAAPAERDADDARRRDTDARRREHRDDQRAERKEAERVAEQVELDDEAERRRKRIEAWQRQKAATAAEEAAAAAASAAAADAAPAMAWTLEDEGDEVAVDAPARSGGDPGPSGAAAAEPEVDPLDAFMATNDAAAAVQNQAIEAAAVAAAEDDDVDPLDAFMATSVLPEVQRAVTAAVAAGAVAEAPAVKAEPGAAGAAGVAPAPAAAAEGTGENGVAPAPAAAGAGAPRGQKQARRRRYAYSSESSGDEDEEESEEENDAEWARNTMAGKLSKGDKLGVVDHSKINYAPFRCSFYIEVPELARMSAADVAAYRRQLDDIKVRGKDIPKPVRSWNQCGLATRVLEILRKAGYDKPLPIQAQALPVIMSGRNCIGIAKTGSGKTLAFVLPMLRHIKDQAPLAQGDGPIALIMAPTRELVVQIGKDVKRFARQLGLTCVCAYGGAALGSQISELKRGAEVVVCTPGRLIDVMATSNGKITNCRRVTYLVMDEADRMFDMGFEPQIARIISLTRPDRQTVMFSATFPRSVELLAKSVLDAPVEIQVGGRSVVNADITQVIELRPVADRFLRLLEILGQWYEKGKVLIFVKGQGECDDLFRDLLKVGYPCLSLHGGKDQSDRESTISDFKSDVCNVLVATGVAARGLDVKELVLVVNFDPPNHHEEYVHRVGRTGRAGNKGTAITFIDASEEEERYAPDLVKALKESAAAVPKDLQALADGYLAKRKAGTVQAHGTGYGGTGFKFDTEEDAQRKASRKQTAKDARKDAGHSESEDEGGDEGIRRVEPGAAAAAAASAANAATAAANLANLPVEVQERVRAAQELAAKLSLAAASRPAAIVTAGGITFVPGAAPPGGIPSMGAPTIGGEVNPLVAAAQAVANRFSAAAGMAPGATTAAAGAARAAALAAQWGVPGVGPAPDAKEAHFEAELEINDFPQHARWKVTHKDSMAMINEMTGAAVTTKGYYVPPGKPPPEGERRLYLLIEGPTENSVRKAKMEIKNILEEYTEKAMRRDAPSSVVGSSGGGGGGGGALGGPSRPLMLMGPT